MLIRIGSSSCLVAIIYTKVYTVDEASLVPGTIPTFMYYM